MLFGSRRKCSIVPQIFNIVFFPQKRKTLVKGSIGLRGNISVSIRIILGRIDCSIIVGRISFGAHAV